MLTDAPMQHNVIATTTPAKKLRIKTSLGLLHCCRR
jgi:hypothetical protein